MRHRSCLLVLSLGLFVGPAAAAPTCPQQLATARTALRREADPYFKSVVAQSTQLEALHKGLAQVGDPAITELARALAKEEEVARKAYLNRERDGDDLANRKIYDGLLEAAGRRIGEARQKLQQALAGKLPANARLGTSTELVACILPQKSASDDRTWWTCVLHDLVRGKSMTTIELQTSRGQQVLAADLGSLSALTADRLVVAIELFVGKGASPECRTTLDGTAPPTVAPTPGSEALARIIAAQDKIRTQRLTIEVTTGPNRPYQIELKKKGDKIVVTKGADSYLVTPEGAFGATSLLGKQVFKLPLTFWFLETALHLEDLLPRRFDGYVVALGKREASQYQLILTRPGAKLNKIEIAATTENDNLLEGKWYTIPGQNVRTERRYYSCDRTTGQCPLAQWQVEDTEAKKTTTLRVVAKQLDIDLPDSEFTPEGFQRPSP